MSAPKHDPEVYVELAEEGLSNVAIGERLGVDEASVRRGLRKVNYQRYLLPVGQLEERFQFLLDEPFRLWPYPAVIKDLVMPDDPPSFWIPGPIMVTADWHIPIYDAQLVNHLIVTARQIGSKTLVIAGDFLNMDSLSRFDPKQQDAGLDREWREAKAVMRVLFETFDQVFYTYGNHDARFVKALGFQIAFSAVAEHMFAGIPGVEEKLLVSNLDHLWIHTSTRDFYVGHPKNYSKVPLRTAIELAAIKDASVLTAHAHHCAVGYAKNGIHIASDVGGLFDSTKTNYLRDTTTYPTWTQGFAWIEPDGRYNLWSPGFSFSTQ